MASESTTATAQDINEPMRENLFAHSLAILDFSLGEWLLTFLPFVSSFLLAILLYLANPDLSYGVLGFLGLSLGLGLWIFRYTLFNRVEMDLGDKLTRIYPFSRKNFYLARIRLRNYKTPQPAAFVIHDQDRGAVSALSAINLTMIPISIQANLQNFLTGLYLKGIPISWEMRYLNERQLHTRRDENKTEEKYHNYIDPDSINQPQPPILEASQDSKHRGTKRVALTIFTHVNQKLTSTVENCLNELLAQLELNLMVLLTSLYGNFPHFQFDVLFKEKLVYAFQTAVFDEDLKVELPSSWAEKSWKEHLQALAWEEIGPKALYVCIHLLLGGFLLNHGNYGIILAVLFLAVYLAKELSLGQMSNYLHFLPVNPFEGLEFYTLRDSDLLYVHQRSTRTLVGLRTIVVQKISEFFEVNLNKIFREQLFTQIPFISQLQLVPLRDNLDGFQKSFSEYFAKTHVFSPQHPIHHENEEDKHPSQFDFDAYAISRAGIWMAFYTFSVADTEKNYLDFSLAIDKIHDQVNHKLALFMGLLETQFKLVQFEGVHGRNVSLSPWFLFLKHRSNFRAGSRLSQFPVLGKKAQQFLEIPAEFQKGIEMIYPAEFQAPIHLESEIRYGQIINTEFNQKEMPFGLNKEQLFDSLLVFGGTTSSRFKIALKLIYENLRHQIPYVIFDFHGNWKNILSLFPKSAAKNRIKILTLGENYGFNLFSSEIENDLAADNYMSIIVDIFKYIYQLNDFEDALLREALHTTPSYETQAVDPLSLLSFLEIRLTDSKSEMRKISTIYSVVQELCQGINLKAFRKSPIRQFSIQTIIEEEGTIILDLSQIEIKKRLLAILVTLEKFKHHITNNKTSLAKIFYIPELYLLFNRHNLQKKNLEVLLTELFYPLLQRGFGIHGDTAKILEVDQNVLDFFACFLALQMTYEDEMKLTSDLLKLDPFMAKMNSKFRKSSNQEKYLSHLKANQGLFKQSDHEFPFAVAFDLDYTNSHFRTLQEAEFKTHMQSLGLDAQSMQADLVAAAKRSQIEQDFQEFHFLLRHIVAFMEYLLNYGEEVPGFSKRTLRNELDHALGELLYDHVKSTEIKNTKLRSILDLLIAKKYVLKNTKPISGNTAKTTYYVPNPNLPELIDEWESTRQSQAPGKFAVPEEQSAFEPEEEDEFWDSEAEELWDEDEEPGGFMKALHDLESSDQVQESMEELLMEDDLLVPATQYHEPPGASESDPESNQVQAIGEKAPLDEEVEEFSSDLLIPATQYQESQDLNQEGPAEFDLFTSEDQPEEVLFTPEDEPFNTLSTLEKMEFLLVEHLVPMMNKIELQMLKREYTAASQLMRSTFALFFEKFYNLHSETPPTPSGLSLLFDNLTKEGQFPFTKQILTEYLRGIQLDQSVPDIQAAYEVFQQFITTIDIKLSVK